MRGIRVAIVRVSHVRLFIDGAEAYWLGTLWRLLVGDGRLRRAVPSVVKVDVGRPNGSIIGMKMVNRGRTIGVEERIIVGISGVELDVRAGVRTGVATDGSGGDGGGSRGRRERVALPLGGEGEDRRRRGEPRVDEPLDGVADGAEGPGVGGVGVRESVAIVDSVGEELRALAAVRHGGRLLQFGAPAAHLGSSKKKQNRRPPTIRRGSETRREPREQRSHRSPNGIGDLRVWETGRRGKWGYDIVDGVIGTKLHIPLEKAIAKHDDGNKRKR